MSQQRAVDGEGVKTFSPVCLSSIFVRLSKWCGGGRMGWQFRIASHRQTNDELSRYVVEVYPLLTRPLTGAILGPLVALENLLVVEVFKRTQSRIFNECLG